MSDAEALLPITADEHAFFRETVVQRFPDGGEDIEFIFRLDHRPRKTPLHERQSVAETLMRYEVATVWYYEDGAWYCRNPLHEGLFLEDGAATEYF